MGTTSGDLINEAGIVTRWEHWRELTGGSGRQRRAVLDWLETHPAILYWGDSWFSTPLYPNLARHSARRIDGLRMIIGKPGATAAELLSARRIRAMMSRIRAHPFDVLAISAGGNDALDKRLERVFSPWMKANPPARLSPVEAFDQLQSSGLLTRLQSRYRLLLEQVEARVVPVRTQFRVVAHSYAPLIRIGVAGDLTVPNIGLIALLKDSVGPWLYGPMKKVVKTPADAREFADLLLLDGFRDRVLAPLQSEFDGLFSYANLDNVPELADPANWYDEIHPTGEGFAACAPYFNAILRGALPDAKRQALR